RAERERAVAQRQRVERARWTRYINQWRKELDAATEEMVRGQKPGVSEDTGFRIARALFHLGVGYVETERWPQAVESFERLLSKHPNGPWHGEGLVRLIELRLTRQIDLSASQGRAEQALVWTQAQDMTRPKSPPSIQPADDAQTHGARPGGVERNADTHEPFDQPQPRPAWQVAHEVYQWLGLLRFIEGDRTAAAEFFRIARPLTPPRTGVQSARERMLVRVYFISRTGRAFPPHAAPTEGGDLGALLILGDLFLEVSDIESAGTLFEHVLQSQGPEQSQSLVSYAHLRRGRCLSRSRDATERAKAGGDFLTAHRLAPEAHGPLKRSFWPATHTGTTSAI
ncbi:MAG: tetratricopeptide repeat protein, partial [Planctomycetaceae bacterium]